MTNDVAIEFKNVFEKYDVEILLDGKTTRESFEALRDISFTIRKGESVAILGPNGAGKSTLLRLIAGLLRPESGEVRVNGRVGSLLDLGAGFHPELTGRDNLLLNASLYNFSREELDAKYDQILAFADIGKFINAPVRCYSQGMYVRLAFSLAIHVDPDILLIDDCLSVGDDNFRAKSLDKALELKAQNKTIVFVTHDFNLAKQMCGRGLYIRESRIVVDTSTEAAVSCYLKPLEVDKERYKYLGAKILEEERLREEQVKRQRIEEENRWKLGEDQRRKAEEVRRNSEEEARLREKEAQWRAEEEKLRKAEEVRRKSEEDARLREKENQWRLEEAQRRDEEEKRRRIEEEIRLKEEEKRWRLEEENRRQEEEVRRRLAGEASCKKDERSYRRGEEEKRLSERERRKQGQVLSRDASLKIIVSPARVQIFQRDRELTADCGVGTCFVMGSRSFESNRAIWRIRKLSESEIFCLLKWPGTKNLFQSWRFKLLSDGTVDLVIMMRSRKSLPLENEILEYCLQVPCGILEEARWGNKARVFSCEPGAGLRLETLREDQICGISMEGKEIFRPYFLTVPMELFQGAERRRVYFKGKFSVGAQGVAAAIPVPASCKITSGRAEIAFQEGSCHLAWRGKRLTTGLGIYTSLYSKGVWYDSAQAIWRIKKFERDHFVAEGFWPWIPVVQVLEFRFKDEKQLFLCAKMKVLRAAQVNMQETVVMLSPAYDQWSSGREVKEFPEGFTEDDFFRFCLWANKADGISTLSFHAELLPSVVFKPADMPGYRAIVENSAHIYGTQSRLFHCLRVNKNEETYFAPGEYDFFKGLINIKEESA